MESTNQEKDFYIIKRLREVFKDFFKEFVEIFMLLIIVYIITDKVFDFAKITRQTFLSTLLLNIIQFFNEETKNGVKSGITSSFGSIILGQ